MFLNEGRGRSVGSIVISNQAGEFSRSGWETSPSGQDLCVICNYAPIHLTHIYVLVFYVLGGTASGKNAAYIVFLSCLIC